jgi:hypothetical protein
MYTTTPPYTRTLHYSLSTESFVKYLCRGVEVEVRCCGARDGGRGEPLGGALRTRPASHGEEAAPTWRVAWRLVQTQTSRAVECGDEESWHVWPCGVWYMRWPARDMNLVPDQEVPAATADVRRSVVSLYLDVQTSEFLVVWQGSGFREGQLETETHEEIKRSE